MNRFDVEWSGYWSAIVTPFAANGEIDEPALAEVVEWTIRKGADGLLVNGSTGEYATQTTQERMRVAAVALEASGGRIPVMVNVTAARIPDARRLAEHAERSGAAGILLSAPGLVRPTTAELVGYFGDVLSATALPACVYNFPQESGHAIGLAELGLLADIDTVVAVKQASSDLRDTLAAIEAYGDRLRVFGHLLSPLGVTLLEAGMGDGYIGSAMLFGAMQPGFFRLVAEGRGEEAREIARTVERGLGALLGPRPDGYNWAFGGMQPTIKAAMTLLGVPGGHPRAPKLALDEAAVTALTTTLIDIGLLRQAAA